VNNMLPGRFNFSILSRTRLSGIQNCSIEWKIHYLVFVRASFWGIRESFIQT